MKVSVRVLREWNMRTSSSPSFFARPRRSGPHLVPVEEHDRARIVELVHGVEVRHLGDVHEVYHRVVLQLICNTHEDLVHHHAGLVVVVPEPYDNHPILLGKDGLIHLPSRVQVRQQVTHRRTVVVTLRRLRPHSAGQALPLRAPRREHKRERTQGGASLSLPTLQGWVAGERVPESGSRIARRAEGEGGSRAGEEDDPLGEEKGGEGETRPRRGQGDG